MAQNTVQSQSPKLTTVKMSRKSRELVTDYAKSCMLMFGQALRIRDKLERIDREYHRQNMWNGEHLKAETANKYGDKLALQNIVVPVIMPQVETSVAYQTETFLTGHPIFAFSADKTLMDTALMYNTIIADQQVRGAWVAEFIKFFRDGSKYNIHALECDWTQQATYTVAQDIVSAGSKDGNRSQVIWQGNSIKRLDPYNSFWDLRVPIHEVHKRGDFAGYTDLMTRIELQQFLISLPTYFSDQLRDMWESGLSSNFYIPNIINDPLIQDSGKRDWTQWMKGEVGQSYSNMPNFKSTYEVTHIYARLVPREFEISAPADDMVQIWKFIIINNMYCIYAERLTNAHNFLPTIFGQPINDGLGHQTRSFADNLLPFQNIATSLWNAKLNSARRRLTDRALYNPSMINKDDINSPEPNAKIPVRNSVYGRSLSEAVYQFPFTDDNSQYFLQEVNGIMDLANYASGSNKARSGQFQKGNKTLKEFDRIMDGSENRDRMAAMFIEAQTLAPLKEILKLNILQYQPAGDVYNRQLEQSVTIDPVKLRQLAGEFKISDGLIPTSTEMATEEWNVAMQTIQSVPGISQGYDVVPMFSYIMKLRGLDGLKDFEKSPLVRMFEQQTTAWQQVAIIAAQKGTAAPPQPQMPPELVAELKAAEAASAEEEQERVSAGLPPSSDAKAKQAQQPQQPQQPGVPPL